MVAKKPEGKQFVPWGKTFPSNVFMLIREKLFGIFNDSCSISYLFLEIDWWRLPINAETTVWHKWCYWNIVGLMCFFLLIRMFDWKLHTKFMYEYMISNYIFIIILISLNGWDIEKNTNMFDYNYQASNYLPSRKCYWFWWNFNFNERRKCNFNLIWEDGIVFILLWESNCKHVYTIPL